MLRNIVRIDEAKCNGCGLCVTACAEGAIAIVDGKAKLVKDQYCDGLGACLGECPQDAITIEQREADAFDEAAVQKHLAGQGTQHASHAPVAHKPAAQPAPAPHKHAIGGCPGAAAMALGGCPGSAAKSLGSSPATTSPAAGPQTPSQLRNWPLQLKLVSPMAPYLEGAKLCIAADCTAFAYPDFHRDMLAGKVLLIACPKLDDVASYAEKLAGIFTHNDIRSVEVVYMEVPCCSGLVHLVRQAIAESAKPIPLTLTKVGLEGGVVERVES
jgi:Pyruvate/2-oxoacid:ferredoxin oxidoreductase delta subunit